MAVSFLHGAGHTTLHKVTIDKKNYPYHAAPKLYAQTGSYVGVTEVVPASDGVIGDNLEPAFSLSAFIASGKVRKIKCRDERGNSFTLLCVSDNVTKAMGNLLKAQIDGNDIKTAWIPRRVGFH